MTRFAATTLCLLLVVATAAVATSGWLRWAIWSAAGGAYLILAGLGIAFIRMRFFADAVCRGTPGCKQVALTFDDGPDSSVTPALLDLLDELGVKATFFCVGCHAREHPDVARQIVARGHLVGNHSLEHQWWLNFRRSGFLRRQIELAQDAIASVTGTRPVYYRPPCGLTNPHTNKALRPLLLKLVGWDVQALDQYTADPQTIIRRIMRGARDGSIIVLHDGQTSRQALLQAVRAIVSQLRQRGYTLVGLDRLLGDNIHKQAGSAAKSSP